MCIAASVCAVAGFLLSYKRRQDHTEQPQKARTPYPTSQPGKPTRPSPSCLNARVCWRERPGDSSPNRTAGRRRSSHRTRCWKPGTASGPATYWAWTIRPTPLTPECPSNAAHPGTPSTLPIRPTGTTTWTATTSRDLPRSTGSGTAGPTTSASTTAPRMSRITGRHAGPRHPGMGGATHRRTGSAGRPRWLPNRPGRSHRPRRGEPLDLNLIKAATEAQSVSFRQGDILMLHTGWASGSWP